MKRQALALLAVSALVSSPALAFEPAGMRPSSTFFYVSIPLDGKSPKEQAPSFGMSLRGQRDYQVINLDSRMMSSFIEAAAAGGIGAQWLMVGGIAAAAAVAVGSKDKSVATQQAQQQQVAAQQQAAKQQPPQPTQPPAQPPAPCPRAC